MIFDLLAQLGEAVRSTAKATFGAALGAVSFQYPPRLELGDLALTAPFDLAKTLRRKPREIAEALARELALVPGIRKAEVAGGGYVNLFLDRARIARQIHDHLQAPRPVPPPPGRTIVEHTSINPNKAAHIGHLRNSILGDTFVNILRHRGHEVGIQNYIDDTGVQVADVVVGFQHLEKKTFAEVQRLDGRFDYYCWDLYARVGDFYAADPANKKLQAETLHAIEADEGETARLATHVAARIVDCHLATMARLGIGYDLLAHESDILRLHFWDRAFELLKESGAIRLETEGKSKGCWVLAMGGEAEAAAEAAAAPGAGGPEAPEARRAVDEDKIIVRSNGTVTYTGKDIAYQLWKFGRLDRDFRYRRHGEHQGRVLWTTTSDAGESGAPVFGHATQVFNVIDVGQSYPQRVVKAGVAALGYADAAEHSYHLAYEKVVLSPATARALGYAVGDDDAVVKVSGRKGLGVKADDLLDALVAKAKQEIATRDPERAPEEQDRAARAIAVGALRYFLLKFSRTRVITFDMEEALAFVGETGPYIQNAVVRGRNIMTKLDADGRRADELVRSASGRDLASFLATEEGDEVWSLLLLAARTDEVAEQAVRSQEVAVLAKHAFAVAQAFHSYYQKPAYSVLHAPSEDLRAFRTLVVDAFLRAMTVLTRLLGMPIPERM
ncbi:MAG TPA: arginine--tRNA ligase [Vicinamibacteria bacterium]|nr:arginine--tRNA ligase [Vicinamibacteria bacterium]